MNDIIYAFAFGIIGAAIGIGYVQADARPGPEQKLLAETAGVLCSNHEHSSDEMPHEVCREWCETLFTNGDQKNHCIVGYNLRTSELMAVDTAMEDISAQ
jgi:hypothetical protein